MRSEPPFASTCYTPRMSRDSWAATHEASREASNAAQRTRKGQQLQEAIDEANEITDVGTWIRDGDAREIVLRMTGEPSCPLTLTEHQTKMSLEDLAQYYIRNNTIPSGVNVRQLPHYALLTLEMIDYKVSHHAIRSYSRAVGKFPRSNITIQ